MLTFERRDMEGEELDGDEIVLLLNGFRFGLRMGNGLVVLVVPWAGVVVVVGNPTAVLFDKNGPWLTTELVGDELEFSDCLR